HRGGAGGERARRAAAGPGQPGRRVRGRRPGARDPGRELRAAGPAQPAPDLPDHPGRAARADRGRRGIGGVRVQPGRGPAVLRCGRLRDRQGRGDGPGRRAGGGVQAGRGAGQHDPAQRHRHPGQPGRPARRRLLQLGRTGPDRPVHPVPGRRRLGRGVRGAHPRVRVGLNAGMDDRVTGAAAHREPGPLRLGTQEVAPGRLLVMAIINRTPNSFYRPGITWDEGAALERVHTVVAEGADIVDVGGVPARPADEVTVAEEIRRTVPFIEAVRAAHPDLVISVDTWRHEVARAVCEVGDDLLDDTWSGWDPKLADVAAEFGTGLVCSHTGGLLPRTRIFRAAYTDVMADVLDRTLTLAQ